MMVSSLTTNAAAGENSSCANVRIVPFLKSVVVPLVRGTLASALSLLELGKSRCSVAERVRRVTPGVQA
jgi:hypothetical protein